MARKDIPYPPSPRNVPEDLTLPSPKFIQQATILVVLIIVIMLVYLGFMGLCVYGIIWAFTSKMAVALQLIVAALCGIIFFFLIKNFFFRSSYDPEHVIEITEEDEPDFFEFLDRLCQEVNAPFPERVYIHPEMDTAMMGNLSLLHLFVPPKRALILGAALINFLNLSELKAVIAHELGHFTQKGFIGSYSYVAERIIVSLFKGNDFLDRFLDRHRNRQDLGGAVCSVLYWVVWVIKHALILIFRMISALSFKLAFEREYICDLVGVTAAGSDAAVTALMRAQFAGECLGQAYRDLDDAADHGLYSADIFLHQLRAAKYVRKNKKDPKYGERPVLKSPTDGKRVQVFDPEEDSKVPEGDYHPSMYDREENAKKVFVPCPMDERSAWVLFRGADDLRERFSYKFYRVVHKVKKNAELADPEKVQKFIDDEHAEMEYDPKYGGVYDGRFLDPGDLDELDEMIEKEPWDDERLSRVEAKLYKGLEKRVEDHNEARKEYNTLLQECNYRPRGKTKRIVDELDETLKENYDWFKSFDRRVYLVYIQMAMKLPDKARLKELRDRYKFHLPLQGLNKRAYEYKDKLEYYYNGLFNRSREELTQDFVSEAFHEFRQARKTLKTILRDAREMDMPMLKNFTGDETLDEFLLDQPLIKELPESYVDTKWLNKMYNQLTQVLKKSARLYFKSVGNILALQQTIAKEFNELQPPAAIPDEGGEHIPDAIVEEGGEEQQEKDETKARHKKAQ
jgi:Zn-dependent protease with chaperone function